MHEEKKMKAPPTLKTFTFLRHQVNHQSCLTYESKPEYKLVLGYKRHKKISANFNLLYLVATVI